QGNAPVKGNADPVTLTMIKDIMVQRMTIPDAPAPVESSNLATTGKPFAAGELWKEHPAVVFVVRRPGCPLCREHGKELLSEKQPDMEAMGVRLVGVVHEKLGVEEFQTGFFKNGEVYFDEKKEFFNSLGMRWMSLSGLLRPSVIQNVRRALGKGVVGNQAGEGRLLGGLMVVGAGDAGIAFEHREQV
ncbi:unnamed protein product, partial [Discosporangium mesarthrocarpum]